MPVPSIHGPCMKLKKESGFAWRELGYGSFVSTAQD
jgi:hypothetical protein